MKENKEDIIKYHQNKRRKHKIRLAIAAIVIIAIAIMLIGIYCILNKQSFINFKENSTVEYRVNLIENEFYDKSYLDEGIDIISNLIKDIDVEFKYDLELEEEIEYTYSYRILAETEVKEKSKSNLIYETEEEILNKAAQEGKANKIEIKEAININYNQYNDQINRLLDVYKLVNTTSELHLSLYLDVINKTTGEQINKENKVMSIVMPLTTKTVEITVDEKVKNDYGQIVIQEIQFENSEYILLAGVITLIIGLIIFGRLIKYISDTRSAEKMYEDQLKKILFDYKSYIQKINNEMNYDDYKVIKIDTFNELLTMREEIQSPILMYTEEQERRTTFMMINGNILFENILAADLIRNKLIEKSKEKNRKRTK